MDIPHLSYEQIRTQAEEFLRQHHSSRKIPVPIERIVEFQLKVDIIPLPGLKEVYDFDGFTSADLKGISVDLFAYEHRPRRYRFTLAHEVGHIVLHAKLFKEHPFRTADEWKHFVHTFPSQEFGLLESQANCFAGLVLVPRDAFEKALRENIPKVKLPKLPQEKVFAKDLVIEMVADYFDVSDEVIERRLRFDPFNWDAYWP